MSSCVAEQSERRTHLLLRNLRSHQSPLGFRWQICFSPSSVNTELTFAGFNGFSWGLVKKRYMQDTSVCVTYTCVPCTSCMWVSCSSWQYVQGVFRYSNLYVYSALKLGLSFLKHPVFHSVGTAKAKWCDVQRDSACQILAQASQEGLRRFLGKESPSEVNFSSGNLRGSLLWELWACSMLGF